MPHELGKLPLTYYQTLVDMLRSMREAENQTSGDDEVLDVDVDALVRKGQRSGFGASG